MRILLLGLFLGLFGWQNLATAQENNYNSLLWEIKGKGLSKPSYLFGTIHIIPKDSFFISKQVERKMKKADRLVMEMKINMVAMLGAVRLMMLPPDQSLDQLMAAEDLALVRSFLQDSISQALPNFERMKPIMVSEHISSQYCMQGQQESYEMYFNRRFKAMGKPRSGLETAKEQMSYLDGMSLEDQTNSLLETVQNPAEICAQYEEMLRLYRQQRLGDLLALTTQDEQMAAQIDQLLYQRNRNWITPLTAMMENESLFIAVGAAHLPGEQGVIRLLQEAGYQVRPLN
jgi:uncharacterized protein YbaP (TraB family)